MNKLIAGAQKKVEERNFEIRKSLLEYDEVMDHQRKIFYSRRRKILSGKGLKNIIEEMIGNSIEKNCETILDDKYPHRCIAEWVKTTFGVELKLSDLADATAQEIEALVKERAKDSVSNDVSLSLGEYLEDYEDPQTWDISGLSKWAMSAFQVSLSPSKVKTQKPE